MKKIISVVILTLGIFAGYFLPVAKTTEIIREVPREIPTLGLATPSAPAVFETTLQSGITTSAVSMTITSGSVRGGTSLSGYNCFTIDEGSSNAEFVCGTVSGTTVSSLTRGVDPATGTSTVSALQFAHRRGANVKITDFPLITIMRNQLSGVEGIANTLYYDTHPTFSVGTQIVDKTYADGLVAAGIATSSETNFGGVWLGTALQQASSTNGGVNKPYTMQTKYSTDTPQSGCAVGFTSTAGAGCSVIARLTGKIRQEWLNLSESWTFTGPVNISATSSNPFKLNSVQYNFTPTQATSSSSPLLNDGAGNVSWGNPIPEQLLRDITATSSTNNRITCSVPSRKFYRISFGIASSTVSSSGYGIQFNGDAGNNYTGVNTIDGAAAGSNSALSSISIVNAIYGAITQTHGTITCWNEVIALKQCQGVSIIGSGISLQTFGGAWNNSTSTVLTSIGFVNTSGNNFGYGSRFRIFGSPD